MAPYPTVRTAIDASNSWSPARTGVAWRVNAERLVLFGWTRAILLQIAHPLVAAGVFDHSGFRASPLAAASRLHHTVKAMLALTFGDEAGHRRAIEGILAIHRRVNGRLPSAVGHFPAGTPYSAEDPSLVLWVHATLIESVLLVHDLLVRPLGPDEHDAYCAEAAPVAVALGAPEAEVPRTRAAIAAYLDAAYRSGAIAVGPQAAELARAIVRPRAAALVAPAAWLNELVTVGLLPEHIREQYGFPWTARRARALPMALATIRTLRRGMPDVVALWKESR
jgi:uncharacterized protein (DUF2236 family)